MDFRVSSRVNGEFAAIFAHYLDKSVDAADRFVGEFERAISEIRSSPNRYALYLPEQFGTIYRHYLLQRYPYSVIYEVTDTEVLILAVAHSSRDAGYWLKEE
ncbi:type II toxin-antitoxin system RelE/ParE family toxin [Aeoliella mucimassa]|uniref:Plasmid stabilization system protein n=1 Tax=Aeoliella mucimassa TaxID=2527972 RepID=A0A518AT34_9BACT|nr:type II toxin-antitoxin system RelE/ParE family toxin [Aeoliella mucimassa]QDU57847.1 Plasmid stabilization system protein [Aeoliella mucimassa]